MDAEDLEKLIEKEDAKGLHEMLKDSVHNNNFSTSIRICEAFIEKELTRELHKMLNIAINRRDPLIYGAICEARKTPEENLEVPELYGQYRALVEESEKEINRKKGYISFNSEHKTLLNNGKITADKQRELLIKYFPESFDKGMKRDLSESSDSKVEVIYMGVVKYSNKFIQNPD